MSATLGRLPIPAMGMCFHYYPGASQREQLKQIKELGFDVIQTEESPVQDGDLPGPLHPIIAWNHIEIGKGKYNWAFLDRLVADCEAVGLKLFHDIELVHHLPEWVMEEHPDVEWVSPSGDRLGHYIRRQSYSTLHNRSFSLAHPAAREAAANFMRTVAARYAGSSAMAGYIIMEEIGLNYPHARTWFGQDVGPATVAGFGDYLQEKYGTLEELNRRYDRAYRDFAEAAGDRTRYERHPKPHRGWMDWCYYRSSYVARFFRGVRDAIKTVDPELLVIASGIGCGGVYWIAQGFRGEEFDFVDLQAHKPCDSPTWQHSVWNRNGWSLSRASRTEMGVSNLNDFSPDAAVWDLTRKMFMNLAMGSRWNALYAWHWYSHEDPKTGKRVLHKNLEGFLPCIQWIREHRDFLGSLTPAVSQVAALNPIRSDTIDFWHNHDPRIGCRSHPSVSLLTMQGWHGIQDLLSESNIPWDTIAEEHLAESLTSGNYRMLVVVDAHLTQEIAAVLRAWVEKGGKLLLMPGAARFDEDGTVRDYFKDLIKQQNSSALSYWELADRPELIRFPDDAKVLLTE
ncbi:MAG: beta-galactosidase, partial [Lentisphaerae bacterium]|nr:beta-galactosidase [Lentisphaerota bacterium]